MPARRLTVVQLVPALDAGGAERSTLEVARALVAAGQRSIVVSAGGRMVDRLRREGSEHFSLDVGRKSLSSVLAIAKLRRLFADAQADIVHARSRMPAWLGWLALRSMRAPPHFVTTVHGLNRVSRYSRIMLRGERVICVSLSTRDYLLRHYAPALARLVVIPRGIDGADYPFGYCAAPCWRERFFREFPQLRGRPLLTLPGRGTRLKGHLDAIALIADLKARSVEAGLLLLGARQAGREAYIDELERIAAQRGIADRVVITAQRDDARDVFAISSLVLQLSNKPESFGRTVVEALSLGRPVLGYDHGGVGELLAELYPAGRAPRGDADALAERAMTLLRDAPAVAPLRRYRLADMQAATLALYDDVSRS